MHTQFQRKKHGVRLKSAASCKQAASDLSNVILRMHQQYGNRTVQRLLKSGQYQAKLTIGQPNDKYEQEANRIADQVMRMTDADLAQRTQLEDENLKLKPLNNQISPLMQRQEDIDEEEAEELLQTKEVLGQTPEVSQELESSINSLRGGGQALPNSIRNYMEPRFGQDFSQVRIHTDNQAENVACSIKARAFTLGQDVVFGTGEYSPRSNEGKRLLAHELTHVIQQNKNQVFLNKLQRFKDPYHEKAIKAGLKGTGLEENWKQVYFGSWLRDYSQLIESDSDTRFKEAVIFVLNKMAKNKFKLSIDEKRLGYYKAEEHMDNPDITPPATSKPIKSSIQYIRSELRAAVYGGRSTDGRIHYGQALHAIQDFFSHTNFVKNVVQMCKKPESRPRPLVSGAFGHKDEIVSLLEMLINYIKSNLNSSQISLTPQEKFRQFVKKYSPFPMPEDNRIPDVYFQDPRQHPENKVWYEALDILGQKLRKARQEAKAALAVPTHSELHQDDPSRPLYSIAIKLAQSVTHELSFLMDAAWSHEAEVNLHKMYQLINNRLIEPEKNLWWKKVLKEEGLLSCT